MKEEKERWENVGIGEIRQESSSVNVETEKNLKEIFESLNSLFAFNLMMTCVILL